MKTVAAIALIFALFTLAAVTAIYKDKGADATELKEVPNTGPTLRDVGPTVTYSDIIIINPAKNPVR